MVAVAVVRDQVELVVEVFKIIQVQQMLVLVEAMLVVIILRELLQASLVLVVVEVEELHGLEVQEELLHLV